MLSDPCDSGISFIDGEWDYPFDDSPNVQIGGIF